MRHIGQFETFLQTGKIGPLSLGSSRLDVLGHIGLPLEARSEDEPWLQKADWFHYGLLQIRFAGCAVALMGFYYTLEEFGLPFANSRVELSMPGLPRFSPSPDELRHDFEQRGISIRPSDDPHDLLCRPPEFVWLLPSGVKVFGRNRVISLRIEDAKAI